MSKNMFVFFVVFAAAATVNAEFWLTATIESLQFNPSCIEASRCEIGESSFKLSHRLPSLKESKSNIFPVALLHEKLTLVSHWEFGNSDELETELSIVKSLGTKPAMTWSCDESQQITLVEEKIEIKSTYALIKVKGRCFNATISLQKYLSQNCPWCLQASASVALTSESAFHLLLASKMQDPFVFWPILIAAALVIIVFILLVFLCVQICCKSKNVYSVSSTPTTSKNPLLEASSPSDSNPSYVNTRTFIKQPYYIRPEYLYAGNSRHYDRVIEFQTPKNERRRGIQNPETPESMLRTPSPSVISNEV